MLDRDAFYSLVQEVFDPLLHDDLGFEFARNAYVRELKSRLRQSMGFDLERSRGETFRVVLGLNSPIISYELPADETGACFLQFLTKSGIADFPRNWPCHNEATVRRSLTKISGMMDDWVIPWLARHRTLRDLAEMLSDEHAELKERLQEL